MDWTYTDAFIAAGVGAPLDTEVIEELKQNILLTGGQTGTDVFSGSAAGTTITMGTAMSDTNYSVQIMLTADPGGKLGEVWIEVLSTTQFKVHNSGKAVTAFRWRAFP